MEDKLCFVQFLHRGGEHEPETGKAWNNEDNKIRGKHRRKFLKTSGRYVSSVSREEKQGEIVFWGEWEPESKVVKEIDMHIKNGPRYIYEPYYVIPSSYKGLRDTDPFIFGGRFKYTNCQQNKNSCPGQLRHLKNGSVILFGSRLNGRFVLDTVFVVDECINHNGGDYDKKLKGKIPDIYRKVTLAPIYGGSSNGKTCEEHNPMKSFRLYFGTTFQQRKKSKGMFSFFPCKPYKDGSKGFARPEIKIEGVISDGQSQGYRYNNHALEKKQKIKQLWKQVVKQVLDQDLMMGTFAELPKLRS